MIIIWQEEILIRLCFCLESNYNNSVRESKSVGNWRPVIQDILTFRKPKM